jgi:hypothetical protein
MVLHKLSLDKPSPSPCENGTDYLIGVENAPKTGKRVPTQSKYLLQSLGKIFSSLAPARAGNSFAGRRPEKEGPLNHDLSALLHCFLGSHCRNYASELVPAAILICKTLRRTPILNPNHRVFTHRCQCMNRRILGLILPVEYRRSG